MKRVWQLTSAASSAKRSSASGSRSIPISVPAGPRRSATRRAWPPPPNVQSTATSPGCGSRTSISSPARTGMCVVVMSMSVAKVCRDVGDTGENALAVGVIGAAVKDLQAVARAGYDHVLGQPGVLHEVRRDHHPVGAVELGVMGEPVEEPVQVAGLRGQGTDPSQGCRGVGLVLVRGPDPDRPG